MLCEVLCDVKERRRVGWEDGGLDWRGEGVVVEEEGAFQFASTHEHIHNTGSEGCQAGRVKGGT